MILQLHLPALFFHHAQLLLQRRASASEAQTSKAVCASEHDKDTDKATTPELPSCLLTSAAQA
jgi:hypothetical protein